MQNFSMKSNVRFYFPDIVRRFALLGYLPHGLGLLDGSDELASGYHDVMVHTGYFLFEITIREILEFIGEVEMNMQGFLQDVRAGLVPYSYKTFANQCVELLKEVIILYPISLCETFSQLLTDIYESMRRDQVTEDAIQVMFFQLISLILLILCISCTGSHYIFLLASHDER